MKVYKWSEDCRVINGAERTVIYDLTRIKVEFVDNEVSALISKLEGKNSAKISLDVNEQLWLDYFLEREFIIEIPKSTFGCFTKLNDVWDSPDILTSVVIHENNNFHEIDAALGELRCKSILVIFDNDNHLHEKLKDHFLNTEFLSIDLLIKSTNFLFEEFQNIMQTYRSINSILVADCNFHIKEDNDDKIFKIDSFEMNGNKPSLHFNLETFFESINHNLYFNRKLFIDENGEIRPSYNSSENLGKVSEIANLIEQPILKNLWNSSKDKTAVCSDCELRRMCVDNRIPISVKGLESQYYYESECEYNPYIAKWNYESGYMNLKESGVIHEKGKVKVNEKILSESLSVIWNEEV